MYLNEALASFYAVQGWPSETTPTTRTKKCIDMANAAEQRYLSSRRLFGVPDVDLAGVPDEWRGISEFLYEHSASAFSEKDLNSELKAALQFRSDRHAKYIADTALKNCKMMCCLRIDPNDLNADPIELIQAEFPKQVRFMIEEFLTNLEYLLP